MHIERLKENVDLLLDILHMVIFNAAYRTGSTRLMRLSARVPYADDVIA